MRYFDVKYYLRVPLSASTTNLQKKTLLRPEI
jgi:hypothetical protein